MMPGGLIGDTSSSYGGSVDEKAALVLRTSRNPQVQQLFARLGQEIDEKRPANPVFFVVDFLCKHYENHLDGFARIWNADPDLEKERLLVLEFFKFYKIPTIVAVNFTDAGFDTLETLATISVDSLNTVEQYTRGASWLPGHKVRLAQIFSDCPGKIRTFRQEREKLIHLARIHGPATAKCVGDAHSNLKPLNF